jgi:hypothetical protein
VSAQVETATSTGQVLCDERIGFLRRSLNAFDVATARERNLQCLWAMLRTRTLAGLEDFGWQ